MTARRLFIATALVLGTALSGLPASAQYATVDWAWGFGSAGNEFANGVAIDGSGNVYVTGQFTNTVDFDPSGSTANLTSAGNTDAFVAKYDSAGAYLWAIPIGGTGYDYGYAIALDGSGNVYIAGQFAGTVDFDPSGASTTRTASGADAFVAAYTTAGAFAWVQSVGGSSNDRGRAVVVNGTAVYAAGEFMGTGVDFDPSAAPDPHSSAGSQDVFLWKLDTGGVFSWARTVGAAQSDVAYGVATNSGGTEVYVTGQFTATVDFDPSGSTASFASAGGTDAFVWNMHADGSYGWTATAGAASGDVGYGVAVDGSGNVLSTGYFNGTADFDPSGATSNLVSAGSTDLFVWRLTSAGALSWARRLGSTGGEIGVGIGVDGSGNPHVAGQFASTICDPAIASAGQTDALLAKWLADGTQVGLNGMGGTGFDDGRAIAIRGSTVAVVGSFETTADFNPGAGTLNRTVVGGRDHFVAHYSALPSTPPAAPEVAVLQGVTPIADGTLTAVDFGSTPMGTPVSLVFTIDNTAGGSALGVASLTFAGSPLPTGGFSNPGGFPSSVVAGGTATFTVQLDAAAVAVYSGTLQFTTTDCDENPYNFPITGTVLAAPEIAVLQGATPLPDGGATAYDFGATLPGQAVDIVFTIDNTAGGANLTVANLRLDGNPFPTGAFSNPGGFPAVVAAGATATFTLRLYSLVPGTFGGTVEFDTNDPDENPYSFVIAGQVNTPVPALSLPGLAALTLLICALGLWGVARPRIGV